MVDEEQLAKEEAAMDSARSRVMEALARNPSAPLKERLERLGTNELLVGALATMDTVSKLVVSDEQASSTTIGACVILKVALDRLVPSWRQPGAGEILPNGAPATARKEE